MACLARKAQRSRTKTASRTIESWAPPEAIGYRLGIPQEKRGPLVFFPRWDLFWIKPFEPPRVPVPGIYTVEFYDGDGNLLPTPSALSVGLFIKSPDSSVRFYTPTSVDGPLLEMSTRQQKRMA